jgi:hypothetical protein
MACEPNHPDLAGFFGRWSWVQSASPVSGVETPETSGYTVDLVFRRDGTYSRTLTSSGGVFITEGTWCLTTCSGDLNGGYCVGQSILKLSEECGVDPTGCELNYDFCPDPTCASMPPGLTRAIQLIAHVIDAPIETYEWISEVPTAESSWSTIKSMY